MGYKIAVVGSGISGLSAAYYLQKNHQVTLIEKDSRIGGHSNTVKLNVNDKEILVDSGFIVFNEINYPNFCKLLEELKVNSYDSDMSFSFRLNKEDFEWSGINLNTLFIQRKNLFSYKFYKMLFDIIRFNQLAKKIEQNDPLINLNLDKFLITKKFSIEFREWYLYPMIASIWSISDAELKKYSIKFIINFFNNHRLTNIFLRPQWKTILGGSISYVSKIADNIKTKKLNASLKLKKVFSNKVCLEVNGKDEYFDKVIFCNHADEIVNLLNEDFVEEKNILKNIKFKNNEVYIHSDISFMPTRNKCWAAWNYSIGDTKYSSDITYYMNKLQNIDTEKPILITLNPKRKIKESLVYEKINYSHPIIDSVAVRAQNSIQKYQGKKNIFFSGAWLGNGFHEAGISSSLNILKMINNYD